MKQVLLFVLLLISSLSIYGQEALDTLYFVDGKIEAVQLTGLTDVSVKYNYYGEGIPISTPKNRLEKIITRSGREIVFENTSKRKTVFSAEDWNNVEITNVESEVEGLIRIGNVSGKAKGVTTLSSLEKLQNRAMTKMRMQAAFLGSDVVFMLNQTNTDSRLGAYMSSTPSSTLSGTAYSVNKVNPIDVVSGKYKLQKAYRLRPNEYELKEISYNGYKQEIAIDKNSFIKDENYYTVHVDSKIPGSNNIMSLLKVSNNEVVFLVINRSKQSKIEYYNLHFMKE